MQARKISLEDKYTQSDGTIYLSGLQALVRLTLLQRERDVAAGLNTAGFVSGYRGSPLGGLDQQFWRAKRHLEAHHVRFQPGVNEDLAATAVWGTQQLGLFPGSRYDGVFAMWYGKGPGVDRCGDVFRHANAAGTAPHGGVLAIAGDDHAARSSTFPHQTEHDFIAAMMPVLNPAGIDELLDFGIIGWAMSRFSGCWIAIKTTAELMDSSATVTAAAGRRSIALPKDFEMPAGGLGIRWPDVPLEQELRLQRQKVYAALAFAAANHLDRIVMDSPRPRFGIITTGKSYLDVRQALDDLGIDERLAAEIGLRLYKVGMPWPLEEDGIRAFARGLQEVLVVEEKRAIIENQLEAQLFNWDAPVRPRVVGKFDGAGNWLLPAAGELTASRIASVIAERIRPFHTSDRIEQRLRLLARTGTPPPPSPISGERVPYFCSGCPHNTSTRLPAGSRGMAGIGCHYMVLWMGRNTATFAHMGGEGAHWLGQAPFTDTKHVFQNLGDGTYFHSGILAIRAAVAAEVTMTYKILYNDAVAMTGGQPVDGKISVAQITHQLHGEGVRRMAVVSVSGEPEEGAHYAPGVTFHDRRDLDRLQLELRDTPGVSVLIYNQMCATELRRRRKRGRMPQAEKRVYINESVCEGCGDCSVVSNCLAVVPVETEFGRKRAINQDSCNQDYSCVEGFCPSFVTVKGGSRAKPAPREPDMSAVPAPVVPDPGEIWSAVLAGVGGSGTVTMSAVLGMAAHIDGHFATALDQTGLAQKFGAVTSYLRISARADRICAARVPAGDADLLIASDSLVGTSVETLGTLAYGASHAVVNADAEMPAAFIHRRDYRLPESESRASIEEVVADGGAFFFPAGRLAHALVGDRIAATFLLLGYAWQRGLVPIREAALREAIELNEVAVEQNWRAFQWGRRAAHDLAGVEELAGGPAVPPVSRVLKTVVARRSAFLEAYQNERYAHRYEALVSLVESVEHQRCGGTETPLADAVAANYFKLLAYKDEYEVARLYTDTDFIRRLRAEAGAGARLEVHLAPPLLARPDPATGRPRKRAFGSWVLVVFRGLRHLRFLRGSLLDPFGYTRERRTERALIEEYERMVAELLERLEPANRAVAVKLASLPDGIRGFGHVKARAIEAVGRERSLLLEQFRRPSQPPAGASVGDRVTLPA